MRLKKWIGSMAVLASSMLLIAGCTTPTGAMSSSMSDLPLALIENIQTNPVVHQLMTTLHRAASADEAAGGVQIAQAQDQNGEMSEDELVSTGEEIYAEHCATCHQPNGQGAGAYPALSGNPFVTDEDPTNVVETIIEGPAQMPSFGDVLTTQQIAAVASYVRNAWENDASIVTVANVSQITNGQAATEQEATEQQQQEAQQQETDQPETAQPEATPQATPQAGAQQGATQQEQAGPTPIVVQIQIIVADAAQQQQQPDVEATVIATAEGTPTGEATPTSTPQAEGDASEREETLDTEATDTEATDTEATDTEESQAQQPQQMGTEGGQVPELGTAVQPNGSLPGNPSIALVKVADGLIDPVNVASPPDGSGRLFILERPGFIRILQDGELLEEPFLDISQIVKIDFLEQGLLGLAFHPDYANNGRFFVYYTDWRTNGDSVLAEFSVSDDDPNRADPESVDVLLTHDQPYVNHNGGNLLFGPDGYLYLGLGDGGLAGDPYRNAQNLGNLLGSIIRVDVDTENRVGYAIPEENPFSGEVLYSGEANDVAQDGSYIPDAQPEILHYGLRNPWQFSFDSETGDLYIADVGQNSWEEINFLPADSQGGVNFGWPVLEGSHCYPEDVECAVFGELPVAEYANPDAGCSITGVGIYRGEESTSLDGIYFASDYCSGRVWGLTRDDAGEWHFAELLDTDLLVAGAGQDDAGELYLTDCGCQFGRDYDPFADPNGSVWRIVAADQVPEGAETASTQQQE